MKPYKEILEFLEKDEILTRAIQSVKTEVEPEIDIDIYLSLLNSIVSQQLSTKVVRVIWNRFTNLYVDRYPKPGDVLNTDHVLLRNVGLSNNKVRYIKNVAEFLLNNDISFDYLQTKSDDEIINYLTQIKGVGRWTVQMILMFPMDRPNVFPVDDLGIQNGMKNLYGIELEKKELKQKLIKISEQWYPYKSLASKYIWKIVD